MATQVPLRDSEATDYSDAALVSLLEQLKAATDPDVIERLSRQIERVVFHKQFENA